MTTFEMLKREAREASKWRGHKMGNFRTQRKNKTAISYCKRCDAWVQIDTKPAPNNIDIGGPSVAVGCPYYEK